MSEKKVTIELVKSQNNPKYTMEVIENFEDYGLSGYAIIELVKFLNDQEYTERIIKEHDKYGMNIEDFIILMRDLDEERKINILETLTPEECDTYRREPMPRKDVDFIIQHIEIFIKKSGLNLSAKDIFLKMYEENHNIIYADFEILDDRFMNTLGADKMNLISCYPKMLNKVLTLNKKQLNILAKCLNKQMEKSNSEEWTILAQKILENIDDYSELINSIENVENVDIEILTSILIQGNQFDIKTLEDINEYQAIKEKHLGEWIESDDIELKKEAVLQKIFGQNKSETEDIIRKYGSNIEEIGDEELKYYIKSLQEILNLKNPTMLEKIYAEAGVIEKTNPILMERMLKNEYGKLYNNGLFKVEDSEKEDIDGVSVYKAGTDFNMLITAVGAWSWHNQKNYYDDWNRGKIENQNISASYIRNDMLGIATKRKNALCYGFCEMADNSLMACGPCDIGSEYEDLELSTNDCEQYFSPEELINKTTKNASYDSYNEIDFRRIQNGKRKQPDYIVIFRENGQITNIDKAKQASKEFGDLPIVVIDVDECLISEKQKIIMLKEEYKKNPTMENLRKIYQKVKNNRKTDENFCRGINLEQLSTILRKNNEQKKDEVTLEDIATISEEITSMERTEMAQYMRRIYTKIKNLLKENEGR